MLHLQYIKVRLYWVETWLLREVTYESCLKFLVLCIDSTTEVVGCIIPKQHKLLVLLTNVFQDADVFLAVDCSIETLKLSNPRSSEIAATTYTVFDLIASS